MKTALISSILVISNLISSFIAPSLIAQVMQDWVSFYDGPDHREDFPKSLAVDNDGNVYVTGYSNGITTGNDYVTIKYNSYGDSVWVRRYNNILENGNDQAYAIAVDDSGNVYVTGSSRGYGTYEDFFTIKYNSAGDELWTQRWDSDFHQGDGAQDITLDSYGNVYVTGSAYRGGNARDAVTIKYNSSGVQQWVKIYSGQLGDVDQTYSIAIDNSGAPLVTGRCGENGYGEYLTIKYNSNGDSLWTRKYDGTANGVDEAYAIVLDESGNAYVTGKSLGISSGYDIVTIKYNPAGDSLWVRRFNGSSNDIDEAYDIAIDNIGNVYVTGESNTTGNSFDYVTIKYNTDGVEQWVRTYNGPAFGWDIAYSIAVDDSGNAYVTGESNGGSPGYVDFATIKYNTNGVEQWVRRYNGTASSGDYGRSVAVDPSGNVYLTGESVSSGTEYDYAVIKYSQSPAAVHKPENEFPGQYLLIQNYPNPFNPITHIRYAIPQSGHVKLEVYNNLGQTVAELVNEEKTAGEYETTFNASHLPSGIYFYQIQADSYQRVMKMILMK